ncbi:MAG: cupin domain-containing protein [Polyangiaceae bacterium]
MRDASPLPSSSQMVVERALNETIDRLKAVDSAEARALLIEARRLRSIVDTWSAIPPPPHGRREMLAKVMELASAVGHTLPGTSGVKKREVAPASDARPPRSEGRAPLSGPREDDVETTVVSTAPYPPGADTTPPVSSTPEGAPRSGPVPVRGEDAGGRALELTPCTPPPARIAEAMSWMRSLETEAAPGVAVLRADAVPWRALPMAPSILAKVLRRDAVTSMYTALVRIPAGRELPAHRHTAPEEMYVIEGAVQVGDVVAQAGDVCHADAGSVHPTMRSATGCLLLIVASSRDEAV